MAKLSDLRAQLVGTGKWDFVSATASRVRGDDVNELQRWRFVVRRNRERAIVRCLVKDPGGPGEDAEFENGDPTAPDQVPWEVVAGNAIEAWVQANPSERVAADHRRNDPMAMTTRFVAVTRTPGPPPTFSEANYIVIEDPANLGQTPPAVVIRGPIV